MCLTDGNASPPSNLVRLEPEHFLRYWQHSAIRAMRAGDRMICGMIAATRLEMEVGQKLIFFHLATMRYPGDGLAPEERIATSRRRNDAAIDQVVMGMHEIAEEVWTSIDEATRLLFADDVVKFRDCSVAPARTDGSPVLRSTQQVDQAKLAGKR